MVEKAGYYKKNHRGAFHSKEIQKKTKKKNRE